MREMGETRRRREKRRTVYFVAHDVRCHGETIDLPVTERFKPCRVDIVLVCNVKLKQ